MEQTSYVQEQYTLTRCSLGSERGVFPSFSPPAECMSPSMDAVLRPHGLESVQPRHRHSLTRWDTLWKQNIASLVEAESGKVRNNGRKGSFENLEDTNLSLESNWGPWNFEAAMLYIVQRA